MENRSQDENFELFRLLSRPNPEFAEVLIEGLKNVFKIHNTKGLEYLLDGHIHNQTEIKKFIEQCKSNENKDGSLKQDFFYNLKTCRAKFLNGPFANLIFEILEKRKNSIKTAFGEATLIIKKKSNYFYSDVYQI